MAAFTEGFAAQTGRILVAGVLLAAAAHAAGAAAAESSASGTFRVNDAKFEIKHAYTWQSPDEFPQPDGPPVRLRFIALSDQPFDAAKLDLVLDPAADVDVMTVKGAATITAGLDEKGVIHALKYGLPEAQKYIMYDISLSEGALRSKDGVHSGSVKFLPNERAHEFDPENWALVEGTIQFEVADTRKPLEGEALAKGGGAPGEAYRAFNDALAAGDSDAVRGLLRAVWTEGGEVSPDPMMWRDVMITNLEIIGGRADKSRAILNARGEADAFGGQADFSVYLVNENGSWKVDSFRPGHE